MTDSNNTVRLHRILKGPAERVYRAFLEPDVVAKWLPPHGFICKVHQMDARAGGTFRMSFTNFSTGKSEFFHGKFHELVPYERIEYTDQFENPDMPGEIHVSITLRKVSCGTELNITQVFPSLFPVEMCYLGWQESLVQLANIVDPEIPDDF